MTKERTKLKKLRRIVYRAELEREELRPMQVLVRRKQRSLQLDQGPLPGKE